MIERFALIVIQKKLLKFFTTNIRNVKFVIVIEVQNVFMKTKINYQVKENYIMTKLEKDYYKNKMIDIQILKNYIDPMLNYKIN